VACEARFVFLEVLFMSITIYTDGSCETQTRIGGYAAILQCGEHRREITGRVEDVTVNVMELTAVIAALKVLKTAGQTVQVFTDSNYVAKGVNDWMPDWITRGWKTARSKAVANAELWQALKSLLDVHDVTVSWIPREQNSDADKLAQAVRRNEPQADGLPQPGCHLLIVGSRDATSEMLDYDRRASCLRSHRVMFADVFDLYLGEASPNFVTDTVSVK
jgi:ribonuclease HI